MDDPKRILTTHAGSLPRPNALLGLLQAIERGAPYDRREFEAAVRRAVRDVVERQCEIGIDIVDDGEESKVSFVAYINDRPGGFESRGLLERSSFAGSREHLQFPEFYRAAQQGPGTNAGTAIRHMVCTGPITYVGHRQLQADIENLKAALKGKDVVGAFIPSTSPANVERWQTNEYYPTQDEYLLAIAEAMRVEYRTIVEAGFLLQIDDPSLATYYTRHPEATVDESLACGRTRIAGNPAGKDPLPHLLRDQHGTAHERSRDVASGETDARNQRRGVFVRSGEPAP